MNRYMLLFIICLSSLAYSQNPSERTLTEEYFPMHKGDLWEYYDSDYNTFHVEVIGDTVLPNGKTYMVFKDSIQFWGTGNPDYYFYRADSVNIWIAGGYYSCDGESIIFKFDIPDRTLWKDDCYYSMIPFDSAYNFPCLAWSDTYYYPDLDYTGHTKVFCGAGIDTLKNDTIYCGSFYYKLYEVTKGIGITRSIGEMAPHVKLGGVIINGVKYGTITGVDERKYVLSNYELYQNYPNPFNPSTKIRYSLIKPSEVQLKIYNPLGQETHTINEGYRSAGTYEAEFDINSLSFELPGGVYFYSIKADGFTKTCRMVYLK